MKVVDKLASLFEPENVEENQLFNSVLTLLVHSRFLLAVLMALLIVEATLERSSEFSSKNCSN